MSQTISQILQHHLDNDGQICGPGGSFSGKDYISIAKVLNESSDNYLIFDNAGGRRFMIWHFEDMQKHDAKVTIDSFGKFIKDMERYAFMYKLEGKETIIKHF